MLTDPQLNAWMRPAGRRELRQVRVDVSGTVQIGGQSWKIQGNWSNAAANATQRLRERRLHPDGLANE